MKKRYVESAKTKKVNTTAVARMRPRRPGGIKSIITRPRIGRNVINVSK
jgi:hypothetical protein